MSGANNQFNFISGGHGGTVTIGGKAKMDIQVGDKVINNQQFRQNIPAQVEKKGRQEAAGNAKTRQVNFLKNATDGKVEIGEEVNLKFRVGDEVTNNQQLASGSQGPLISVQGDLKVAGDMNAQSKGRTEYHGGVTAQTVNHGEFTSKQDSCTSSVNVQKPH